jgi:DNA invertase Pin-like site-specific DNA recombinase
VTLATVRCAIYTRKSSEEGLEQGFNSLHAQREACEAYVLSQRGEGWQASKKAYDDGGFSGGSIERPGLKALLADIAAGRVDVVVVYKVDRLTRSLTDFAKIVEAFDAQGVSFVSVTQAFNTTTSMGRLTLNVLLSFAQFEREVTGERIRDKIAASRAKGMWMGGTLPLGYDRPIDPLARTLVVNEIEAATVRSIFQRYLEIGSVHAVRDWLDREGIRSKAWVSAKGRQMGGCPINRGALFHLLKNRTYLGEVVHKDKTYPGLHPSIVDRELFDEVQAGLASQARAHVTRSTRVVTMPLRGVIFDADGEPMTPSFTRKSDGRAYRYYVSAGLLQGRRRDPADDAVRRVAAVQIEELAADTLRTLSGGLFSNLDPVVRIEVYPSTVQIVVRTASMFRRGVDPLEELEAMGSRLPPGDQVRSEDSNLELVRATIRARTGASKGGVIITGPSGRPASTPLRPNPSLIAALRAGHQVLVDEGGGGLGHPEGVFFDRAPPSTYQLRLACLAFLAPDIQAMILEGRQPPGLDLGGVLQGGLPPSWEDQRRLFRIPC